MCVCVCVCVCVFKEGLFLLRVPYSGFADCIFTVLFNMFLCLSRASLVAQMVKNLPAVQETWVRSLDQTDPLEKGMANHSCILAWRIPWTGEPEELQSIGSQSQTQWK